LLTRNTLITRVFHVAGLTALLLVSPVHGQDRDFDLPAGEFAEFTSDGGLELADAEFTGSPIKRFAERWPDDLVIAPIPGRSPQVGWTLAVAGGYFLESEKEDAEHAPSVIGGFGWYAENDSYAFGAGGNLHLLDDDLRVKFGAAYMDVRYRFYGIGERNDLGVSVDILREAPMYFTSASYWIWKKLYVGTEYYFGVGEAF